MFIGLNVLPGQVFVEAMLANLTQYVIINRDSMFANDYARNHILLVQFVELMIAYLY